MTGTRSNPGVSQSTASNGVSSVSSTPSNLVHTQSTGSTMSVDSSTLSGKKRRLTNGHSNNPGVLNPTNILNDSTTHRYTRSQELTAHSLMMQQRKIVSVKKSQPVRKVAVGGSTKENVSENAQKSYESAANGTNGDSTNGQPISPSTSDEHSDSEFASLTNGMRGRDHMDDLASTDNSVHSDSGTMNTMSMSRTSSCETHVQSSAHGSAASAASAAEFIAPITRTRSAAAKALTSEIDAAAHSHTHTSTQVQTRSASHQPSSTTSTTSTNPSAAATATRSTGLTPRVSNLELVPRAISTPTIPAICSLSTMMRSLDPDTLETMFRSEQKYQPSPDYYQHQQHLEDTMRPILLDWMMEVSQEFSLGRETFHLAVNYVDRFLTLCPSTVDGDAKKAQSTARSTRRTARPGGIDDPNRIITRVNLQLLGVTCLSIAAKLEEIYPPAAQDFATTTDGAYTVAQIDLMERTVLRSLDWRLAGQTPFSWMKVIVNLSMQALSQDFALRQQTLLDQHHTDSNAVDNKRPNTRNQQGVSPQQYASLQLVRSHADSVAAVLMSVEMFERAMILIDMAALDLHFLSYYPSAIATSAFLLVYHYQYNYHVYHEPKTTTSEQLQQHLKTCVEFPVAQYVEDITGYSVEILRPCIASLQLFLPLAMQQPRPARRLPPQSHLDDLKIPVDEIYGRQIHYQNGLAFLNSVFASSNSATNAAGTTAAAPTSQALTAAPSAAR